MQERDDLGLETARGGGKNVPEHPTGGWPVGDLPMTGADSDRFRMALAWIAPDRTSAEMLLGKIGVPAHRLPPFQGSPDRFWYETFRILKAGVVHAPRRRLLEVALTQYEANTVLCYLHERYVAGPSAAGPDTAGPGPQG
jgi:hypothetical protein